MKFLLVVFAFTMTPSGELDQVQVMSQPFNTLEECNYVGSNLRELTGTNKPELDVVKTVSYCVRPEDYKKGQYNT